LRIGLCQFEVASLLLVRARRLHFPGFHTFAPIPFDVQVKSEFGGELPVVVPLAAKPADATD
jgi:hypothetical protein